MRGRKLGIEKMAWKDGNDVWNEKGGNNFEKGLLMFGVDKWMLKLRVMMDVIYKKVVIKSRS